MLSASLSREGTHGRLRKPKEVKLLSVYRKKKKIIPITVFCIHIINYKEKKNALILS